MCQFLSVVITKSGKVYGDGSYDDHSRIINENKDKDKELCETENKEVSQEENLKLQKFARVEITPKDGNIFNHKLGNWKIRIDEQITPMWWDKESEKLAFKKLKEIFKTQFIIGGEYGELNRDVRFLKDCTIKVLRSTVQKVYGGGTVQKVWGGGTVQEVCGGGIVQKVWGGTVQKVCDGGTVQKVYGGGTVQEVWGGGTVQKVCDGGTVQKVCDGGTVQKVYGGGTVQEVWGGGTVQKVCGGGTVQEVYGGGIVQKALGNTIIVFYTEKSFSALKKIEGGNNVLIKKYLQNVEVVVK
jgi:hypothetical protein